MKIPGLVLLGALLALSSFAAEAPRASATQAGKMSTVQLLATSRIARPTPDGVRFLFLVKPVAGGSEEKFAIKETRDFLIDGKSYQEKTQAELGKKFEPETSIDSAEGFFAKQPGARRLAPEDIKGGKIVVLHIGGAPLTAGASGEVTLHVGFDLQAEPLTFAFRVPPAPPAARGTPPPATP